MKTLGALVDAWPGAQLVQGDREIAVEGLVLDSRRAGPGTLFAALAGHREDGARYVDDARRRGAVAVLSGRRLALPGELALVVADDPRAALAAMARRLFGEPDERLDVVGVTGTDGKTTTVELIRAALEGAGIPASTAGTLGFRIGSAARPADLTTPEAPEVWRFLADAEAAGARAAALEVSSIALDERRVTGLRWRGAVLTSLGRDHLDYHGSPERYHEAKRTLFHDLDAGAFAVLPREIADRPEWSAAVPPARLITVGRDERADWRVCAHRARLGGASFRLEGPGFAQEVDTARPAPWDALNLAAAVAAASALGADPRAAVGAAAALGQVPGRWQVVDEGQPFAAIVDFAHTPDAVGRVVGLAAQLAAGRVISVLGAGGGRDPGKRRPMGRAAGAHAGLVIVTDDNPRGEDPESIAAELVAGVREAGAAVERIPDRAGAIVEAVERARPGDVVLVLGKGHETTQRIGERVIASDDRELLRDALRRAGKAS